MEYTIHDHELRDTKKKLDEVSEAILSTGLPSWFNLSIVIDPSIRWSTGQHVNDGALGPWYLVYASTQEQVRASPEAVCVLPLSKTRYALLSTSSTQEDLYQQY